VEIKEDGEPHFTPFYVKTVTRYTEVHRHPYTVYVVTNGIKSFDAQTEEDAKWFVYRINKPKYKTAHFVPVYTDK
jgi:hypothetical protein